MPSAPRSRYAIVIPTRNRQRYCVEAVRSVVAAGREDALIVVADASDDPAALPALLARAGLERRARLLPASERRLSMRENWERALAAADAEWLCYLGDDDALTPDGFDSFDALTGRLDAEVFAWEPIDYRWPCYPGGSGGQLILPTQPPAAARVDAAAFLEQHRQWRTDDKWPAIGPSIYHGLVSRRLIDRVVDAHGAYFQNFVVDYASAIFNLTAIDSFVYLRAPLTVLGACGRSNSAGLTAAEQAAKTLDQTLAENPGLRPIFPELYGSRLSAPLVAQGYRELFRRLHRPFEITPAKLLRSCVAELRGLADAAAFEREQTRLAGFAAAYGLTSAPIERMRFAPQRCGVGVRTTPPGAYVDTQALGWSGIGDVLTHLRALTPGFGPERLAAIEGLARRGGRKAA